MQVFYDSAVLSQNRRIDRTSWLSGVLFCLIFAFTSADIYFFTPFIHHCRVLFFFFYHQCFFLCFRVDFICFILISFIPHQYFFYLSFFLYTVHPHFFFVFYLFLCLQLFLFSRVRFIYSSLYPPFLAGILFVIFLSTIHHFFVFPFIYLFCVFNVFSSLMSASFIFLNTLLS